MRIQSTAFTIILCFFSYYLQAQIETVLPILSDPQILLDENGTKIASLPKGEQVINSLDGKPDRGWIGGMADIELGTCGNIITYNQESNKHSIFDLNTKRSRQLRGTYKSITPCSEGYHLAEKIEDSKSSWSNSYYYFLDTNGNTVFSPKGYYKADVFNDGLAAVRTRSNKWVYINDLGHELDIIPPSILKIKEVTSFFDGVSVITTLIPENKIKRTYRVYMINKKGDIIFDSQNEFNGIPIKRNSRSHNGIVTLSIYQEDYTKSGDFLAYVNSKGEVFLETKNIFSFKISEAGLILAEFRNQKNEKSSSKIYNNKGIEISIPEIPGTNKYYINRIKNQYFRIIYKLEGEKSTTTIFDATLEKNIYTLNDLAMAVKGNLISMKNSKTKRFYVEDLTTNKIVYDTKLKEQTIHDLSSNLENSDQIKTFVCSDIDDVKNISKLTELHELTIRIKDLKEIPDLRKLTKLKILRLDNCRALTKFPNYLNTLTQLSLRSCTSSNNLIEMVDGQKNLEKLFIVNMDISEINKTRLRKQYPDCKISGNAKHADYELQEVIFGF